MTPWAAFQTDLPTGLEGAGPLAFTHACSFHPSIPRVPQNFLSTPMSCTARIGIPPPLCRSVGLASRTSPETHTLDAGAVGTHRVDTIDAGRMFPDFFLPLPSWSRCVIYSTLSTYRYTPSRVRGAHSRIMFTLERQLCFFSVLHVLT